MRERAKTVSHYRKCPDLLKVSDKGSMRDMSTRRDGTKEGVSGVKGRESQSTG